jgi:hypothetical protein
MIKRKAGLSAGLFCPPQPFYFRLGICIEQLFARHVARTQRYLRTG